MLPTCAHSNSGTHDADFNSQGKSMPRHYNPRNWQALPATSLIWQSEDSGGGARSCGDAGDNKLVDSGVDGDRGGRGGGGGSAGGRGCAFNAAQGYVLKQTLTI